MVNAIHQINLYPPDSAIGFPNIYPQDSDLSGGECYPAFEQLGPVIVESQRRCKLNSLFREQVFLEFVHPVLSLLSHHVSSCSK